MISKYEFNSWSTYFLPVDLLGMFFSVCLVSQTSKNERIHWSVIFNAEHEGQMFLLAKPKKVPTTLLFTCNKESDSLLFILFHDFVYTMYWKIRKSNTNPKSKIQPKSLFIYVMPAKPYGMTIAQQQPRFYAPKEEKTTNLLQLQLNLLIRIPVCFLVLCLRIISMKQRYVLSDTS